ncbi:MAG: sulfotransferase domain-containing protein [Rhodospirillales bacterium]|nr:sulfotransferase domain-containing protein [Rhodospirillales bacterium]MDE2457842.1 sulfotransferase domain-containing protein [Rhodospirillales bacterium]
MGKLVWLASYPKSGNTWVRAFLHNYIVNADTPHSINSLVDFSVAECAAAFFGTPEEVMDPYTVQAKRPEVHAELTRLHDDLVFVKTHNANLSVHGVSLCTPGVTAGAIYIVRDPRDVALSYAAFTGKDVDEIIDFMGNDGAANASDGVQVFELLSSWSSHALSWVAAPRRLLVRYEDLLADPVRGFGRVIRFLGAADATPEPERLHRAIAFSRFDTLADQEAREGYQASGARCGKFFRSGKAGGWREKLSAAQAAKIWAAHGQVMEKFGYPQN